MYYISDYSTWTGLIYVLAAKNMRKLNMEDGTVRQYPILADNNSLDRFLFIY
jgi:hypothetical protein